MNYRHALHGGCVGALLLLALACSDGNGGDADQVIPKSVDPDSVAGSTALVGRVVDYHTAKAVGQGRVSLFPPTGEAVATRDDGTFALTRDLRAGQVYTLLAEADGYRSGQVPALVKEGRATSVDVALISDERALAATFDPPVVAFTPSANRVNVSMIATGRSDVNWTAEFAPQWLSIEPSSGTLEPGGVAALDFRLQPEAFATAISSLAAGEELWSTVEFKDADGAVALLYVLAIPAGGGDVTLNALLEADADASVRVGRSATLFVRAKYREVPLRGAEVGVEVTGVPGGLVPPTEIQPTGEDGLSIITLQAESAGSYEIELSLPAHPTADTITVALAVSGDGACATDNGGCGDPRYTECSIGADGEVECIDIDECEVDADGDNGCGVASRWTCVNRNGEPPDCIDIDECLTDNGGCGDRSTRNCANQSGAAPVCSDVDGCSADNGGCGDRRFIRCVDTPGQPIQCVDVDECAASPGGLNGCGDPARWTCVNNFGAPPTCTDVDECALRPDLSNGCGAASRWMCVNNTGAPPTCSDIDECATNNGGCGTAVACTNVLGGAPVCADIDECLVANGGCGDPQFSACVNRYGAPPVCIDVNECALDASGFTYCGDPAFTTCIDNVGAAPTCVDIDECAVDPTGSTICGDVRYTRCVNNVGGPPACSDIDECATNNGGCGVGRNCIDVSNAPPLCFDIDECATNNGGCGDPAFVTCTNLDGAPPICADIEECAVGSNGLTSCGDPAFIDCQEQFGAAAICTDVDECADDGTGSNGCGVVQYWTCTNNVGSAPTCVDVDECAANNGGCNPTWQNCTNNAGAPASCSDIDECAANNGGCGDPAFAECVNNVFAPPTCLTIDRCSPDTNGLNFCGVAQFWDCAPQAGTDPICTDIDECAVGPNGVNICGIAAFWTCTDNVGAAATCIDLDECATNNGGCDPVYQRCLNNPGAPPACADVDECAIANGGCGDAAYWQCVDQVGGPPICKDIDECVIDVNGDNGCGNAASFVCTNNIGNPPSCVAVDECEIINEANACGDPYYGWICFDDPATPANCTACPPGGTNLDNDPLNGCEYTCASNLEVCNQQDDDCDGLVDEGFDLRRSQAHCGECGSTCGPLPNAADWQCSGGTCLVKKCELGFRDANGDGADGCELAVAGAVIYVDAFLGSPAGPGTPAAPFSRISSALTAASAGDTIAVGAGVYQERVTVTLADIALRGDDRQNTILVAPDTTGTVLEIAASGVSVSGLTVSAGRVGISVNGAAAPIARARIFDVAVSGQTPAAPPPSCSPATNNAIGIHAVTASNVIVTLAQVNEVKGSQGSKDICCSGCNPGSGGFGAGINMSSVNGCKLLGNTVFTVAGGEGGQGNANDAGGAGGDAHGIRLVDAAGCLVAGNDIFAVTGGLGGSASFGPRAGTAGRFATGVYVNLGVGNQLSDNRVDNIAGGAGGPGLSAAGGTGGSGHGVYLNGTGFVQAYRNEVRNIFGGSGGGGTTDGNRGPGFGLRSRASSNVTVTGLAAWNIDHGTAGGADSSAQCVYAEGSSPLTLNHLTCRDIGINTPLGYGVRVVVNTPNSVTLSNSIFANVSHTCLRNQDVATALSASYTNLFQCGLLDIDNASTSGFMYADNPQFAPEPLDNLHLLPVSRSIDAGDPVAAYSNEPAPDGCRVNLGAYGNTRQATAAPGAPSCN